MLGLIVVATATLGLLAGALWLVSMARTRERSQEVMSRLLTAEPVEAEVPLLMDSPEMEIPGMRWMSRLLWRGGSAAQPRTILILAICLVLLLALVPLVAGLTVGAMIDAVGMFLLISVLRRRARRRRARILEQLPEYLENLIRVIAAGNSIEEGLDAAARESSAPIRPLFMSVGRQVRLGETVDRALVQAGELYDLRDLRIMALAASVNRRYGGSLREVLKSLIAAVRQRGTAAKELKAMTANTRFSGIVLALVPIAVTALMASRNPHYYDAILDSDRGIQLLIGAVLWQVAGMILLWRMVNSVGDSDE